jgi:hypothetical protein
MLKQDFKNKKNTKRIEHIINSKYTFLILSKIYHGLRPSQIGKQLRISPQLVYYHMDNPRKGIDTQLEITNLPVVSVVVIDCR